ncbi:MAG: replication-associated recombination protein A [Parachlamydiaceae bacterium]|nr:replication-associated recombination protein A [Parachlamydiaceae bacterium]
MKKNLPLAEELRAKSLDEIVGQNHLFGEHGLITRAIKAGTPLSIVLWGPPGCGKTSIARLYAKAFDLPFTSISAIFSGVADIRKIIKEAEDTPLFHKSIILFVDEIHRFNKAQQDAFLPFIENGTLILVGATVENPSFHLNPALLSRLRVLPLYPLDPTSLEQLVVRYETRFGALPITSEARQLLISWAQGDGRYLYNLIENLQNLPTDKLVDEKELGLLLQKRAPLYDREEHHYNLISALHKSVRGSDPDATLYWLLRMLDGGEEPLFLARRLIRMAVEDVGLADPNALQLAIAAKDAYEMLGSPEGELALAEVAVYLALAPKSNSLYTAYGQAKESASQTGHLSPPPIILNAPTKLMKQLGYGKGYQYDHDMPEAFSGQNYFPTDLKRQEYYHPVERGFEREMKKRMDYFNKLRERRLEEDL